MRTKVLFLAAVTTVLVTTGFTSSAQAAALSIEARVDTEVCASGAVQCTVPGTGHTAEAATSANHNPIRMFVEVVKKSGVPLAGLVITDFTFVNTLVPAGGGAAGICSEANCTVSRFQTAPNGLYSIFLDRIPAGNWKTGTYAATITVISGLNQGTAIVTFTIPAAAAAVTAGPPWVSPAGQAE